MTLVFETWVYTTQAGVTNPQFLFFLERFSPPNIVELVVAVESIIS